jgi:hypothetical protein
VVEPPVDLAATVRTLRNRWQQELAARGVDRDTAAALDRRYAEACRRVIVRWPAAFKGTDLDPEANRRRMEALVKHVEELAASLGGGPSDPGAQMSPQRLASMLGSAGREHVAARSTSRAAGAPRRKRHVRRRRVGRGSGTSRKRSGERWPTASSARSNSSPDTRSSS